MSKKKMLLSFALISVSVIIGVLVLTKNGISKEENFSAELDVYVDSNTVIRVSGLKIFPRGTVINGPQSSPEEGIAEKYLRMWYSPQSIEQYYSLYTADSKPAHLDEESFMEEVRGRAPGKDYLLLDNTIKMSYNSRKYILIKYIQYKDGLVSRSNAAILEKDGEKGDLYHFTDLADLPYQIRPFHHFFWHTKSLGYAYLIYKDTNLTETGKSDVADMLSDIRERCLMESGEFCVKPYLNQVKIIRRKGTPEERSALKHLMIQPIRGPDPIKLTESQYKQIRFDLRGLEKDQIDEIIWLIERGTLIDASIALEEYNDDPSLDAEAIIEEWIGK